VLKNTEVQSLITALGTGIHDDFDLSKLRYHKVVLMADADVDGRHITTLPERADSSRVALGFVIENFLCR
jgi:DNA gyrase/topoisomerase IV subunit B